MENNVCVESSTRLNILLVEDDVTTQRIIARFLERVTCAIDIAGDGVEAIDKLLEKEFDLILMDIRLPNLDGFELIRYIREQEPETKKRVPIIAMTASELPEDYHRAMEAGADSYVLKPITPEIIEEILDQFVKN
ncbi:MAG: response regulator [Deltaproteobacteria bacterium]|nr:response regulator [Deltaproteobacteria bacterium]